MFLSCSLSAHAASSQPALRGPCLLQQPHLACSCWQGASPEQCQAVVVQGTATMPCSVLTATSRDAALASKNTALHISPAGHFRMARGKLSLGGKRSSIPYSLGPFVKLLRDVLNSLQGFFKAVFFPRPKKLRITGSSKRLRKGKGKQQPGSTQPQLVSHYMRRQ